MDDALDVVIIDGHGDLAGDLIEHVRREDRVVLLGTVQRDRDDVLRRLFVEDRLLDRLL